MSILSHRRVWVTQGEARGAVCAAMVCLMLVLIFTFFFRLLSRLLGITIAESLGAFAANIGVLPFSKAPPELWPHEMPHAAQADRGGGDVDRLSTSHSRAEHARGSRSARVDPCPVVHDPVNAFVS